MKRYILVSASKGHRSFCWVTNKRKKRDYFKISRFFLKLCIFGKNAILLLFKFYKERIAYLFLYFKQIKGELPLFL